MTANIKFGGLTGGQGQVDSKKNESKEKVKKEKENKGNMKTKGSFPLPQLLSVSYPPNYLNFPSPLLFCFAKSKASSLMQINIQI